MSNADCALGTCHGSIADANRRDPAMTMTKPMAPTARSGTPSLGSEAALSFDIRAFGLRVTGLAANDSIRLNGATAASVHASDFTISS